VPDSIAPPAGLRIEAVSKSFHAARGATALPALDRVSLEAQPGEFLALIGPSGCGKSTLLLLVAGLETPDSGRIVVDGRPVTGPGRDRGVMFQDYALFPWLTVTENIAFGLRAKGVGRPEREAIVTRHVELVGLRGHEEKFPHELSGGMRQRTALARVLANDPSVLLMDEPLAALDALTRRLLQQELLRVWGEDGAREARKTVLLVTHDIEEAVFLADRILVMSRRPGRIKLAVDNPLPRPRTPAILGDPRFTELVDRLWREIEAEAYQAMVEG
jgi:NitT/TauT family transport system ATP-binding protein